MRSYIASISFLCISALCTSFAHPAYSAERDLYTLDADPGKYLSAIKSLEKKSAITPLSRSTDKRPVSRIIDDSNHTGQPTFLPGWFRWTGGEQEGTTWYPQGITGSWDSTDSGKYNGNRVMAVSWYDKDGKEHGGKTVKRGVRVSFIDRNDPAEPKFRHIALVIPGGKSGFKPLTSKDGSTSLHAGGIAWSGHNLYVADTRGGIRVFDLRYVWKMDADSTHARFGVRGNKAYAADYRYAIPQMGTYKNSTDLRFSSVSIDHKTNDLITGEYKEDDPGGRVVRWPMTEDGKLEEDDGEVEAVASYPVDYRQMQGAVTYGMKAVTSHSDKDGLGIYRRWEDIVTGDDERADLSVSKPQDISYDEKQDIVWGNSEEPGTRFVFPMRAYF